MHIWQKKEKEQNATTHNSATAMARGEAVCVDNISVNGRDST